MTVRVLTHIVSNKWFTDVLRFGNRIAYVEFKTEEIAEKMLEEAQGADVQGRSIMVDFTGEKSRQGGRCE